MKTFKIIVGFGIFWKRHNYASHVAETQIKAIANYLRFNKYAREHKEEWDVFPCVPVLDFKNNEKWLKVDLKRKTNG